MRRLPAVTLAAMISVILAAAWLSPGRAARPAAANLALDLRHQRQMPLAELLPELGRAAVILVGEHHTNPDHHVLQLQVIAHLAAAGHKLALGLEMFRRESQAGLDRWVAGEVAEAEMERLFFRNWSFDWQLYRPILIYARDHKLPLVALNVSPDLTRQVATRGFDSLSRAQKGALSDIACDVDDRYRDFIRRSHGAHGHGQMNFDYFCEAQMVWDDAMALHAVKFLEDHPDYKLVVLAGSGHVRKSAIPTQIRKRAALPLTVLLPYARGSLDPAVVDHRDADFIVYPPYGLP